MRRVMRGERGATLVIVAIVVLVLFGFTALAIDAARAYEERRELQRTADVSALSGAQELRSQSSAAAEAVGEFYVAQNPTVHHPGIYNELTGDLVQAFLRSEGGLPPESCVVGGVTYDCVHSRVVAPPRSESATGFEWVFAKVMGFEETDIMAEATALLGSGAPGGDKLVPWLVLDCPTPTWEGDDWAAAQAKVESYTGCPYTFNDDYDNESARENLFLSVNQAHQGNFYGAALNEEPDCPPTLDGLFAHSGGNEYEAILSGAATPCNIGKGARVYPNPGVMAGPTKHALDTRDIDSCTNEESFHATVDVGDVEDDGEVSIQDHSSPCLLALLLIVNADPDHPQVETQTPGGSRIAEFQHPDAVDGDADGEWRFAGPKNGASSVYVTRRFAFFYITDRGGPQDPYRGLFLKAFDSANARLDGQPCTAEDGICVVKLVK